MEAADPLRLRARRSALPSPAEGSGGTAKTGDCAPLAMIGEVVPEVFTEVEVRNGADAIRLF